MSRRLTPEERLLRAVTEQQWQTEVNNTADLYGWLYYHPPDNRPVRARSGRTYVQNVRGGFPDNVFVHPERNLFMVAELKTETGVLSPEQIAWLSAIRAAGIRAEVWRPRDRDLVRAILGPQAAGWDQWRTSGRGAAAVGELLA